MFRKTGNWVLAYCLGLSMMTSCGTDDSIPITTDVIRNATEANNFIVDIYEEMTRRSLFRDVFVIVPLLFSDNCYYAGIQDDSWEGASDMEIDPEDTRNWEMFTDLYSINQDINVLFAQLDTTDDETLTDAVKNGFRAEGRAIRAALYYYLYSYWGNVPLIDENTDQSDTTLVNATDQELLDFMEEDLLFADANISGNTWADNSQRLGAMAIKSWLSRFYLQYGDGSQALNYAEDVLQSGTAVLEVEYENVFNVNSSEHIWVLPEDFTSVSLAYWFLQPFSNGLYVIRPRTAIAFEEGDSRRDAVLSVPGSTIIKYKDVSSNSDPAYLFRLAEIYLIAAEAAIRANDDYVAASQYLNIVRNRAGLDDLELDADNYVDVILRERNAELCYEGFHRLLDLRRFGMASEVLGEFGYDAKDDLWPIPELILDRFSAMEQNPGY